MPRSAPARPARVGLSVVKAARKTGRLGTRLGEWIARSLRGVVDWSGLRKGLAGASLTEPAVAVRAVREAVKVEKADDLLRLARDVGRVQTKAGTKAALDGLKTANTPVEMARIAKLAEKNGNKTRAILKLLGRGAIALTLAAFDLALWIFWALLMLFGFVSSMKAAVERTTHRAYVRKKAKRVAEQHRRLASGDRAELERRPHCTSESNMPTFNNGDVQIAFLDEGEGDPIVLVHGFASSKEVNWVQPGWVSTLTRAGRRVIALDNRGHGAIRPSSTIRPPITATLMAEDVRALLDHLSIDRADVMGYSMGARITAFLALQHPARVRSAILGGLGIKLVDGVGLPEEIAVALEAPSLDDVTDPLGRMFRAFADQTKSDLPRARRLYPRLAPGDDARTGRADQDADADRGRKQGRYRRFRRKSSPR